MMALLNSSGSTNDPEEIIFDHSLSQVTCPELLPAHLIITELGGGGGGS